MPEIKTKICPICKNGFIKPLNYTPSRWARKMHCSQNCWHQYLRLIHKGKKLSMGMIEKLRKINMGNKYNLGRKNGSPSLETKRKISLALLGKPGHLQTEETRKKISLGHMGKKKNYPSYWKGKERLEIRGENHYLWNKVPYPSIGRKLIENRDLFLSKKARFSYCGYAYAQVKRLKALNKNVNANKKRLTSVETYGFDTKNALHCIRLMRQGLEILVDGELNVFRHDAQFLLDIKAGKYTYEQIVEMFNEYEHLIEGAYVRSSLPHKPNFDKAEKLLVEIVEEFLYG